MSWWRPASKAAASPHAAASPSEEATTLLQVCSAGQLDDVVRLLGEGADTCLRGEFGATPLIRSAEQGHAEIVSLLLRHGAAVDAQDDNGDSALLCASRMGRLDVVRLLLSASADPGVTNSQGVNSLDAALDARNVLCRPEVSELLVSHRRGNLQPTRSPLPGAEAAAAVAVADASADGAAGGAAAAGVGGVGAPGAAELGSPADEGKGGSSGSGEGGSGGLRYPNAGQGNHAPPLMGVTDGLDGGGGGGSGGGGGGGGGAPVAPVAPVLRLRREEWAQDRNYPQCHLCKANFTVFNRRHHCRICGLVFCDKCTSNSLTANLLAPGAAEGSGGGTSSGAVLRVRVCNECAALHSGQSFGSGYRIDERGKGHPETREVGSGGCCAHHPSALHAAPPALSGPRSALFSPYLRRLLAPRVHSPPPSPASALVPSQPPPRRSATAPPPQ